MPGNVAELLTLKARLADHLRAEFTFNGNILVTHVYYTGKNVFRAHSASLNGESLEQAPEGPSLPGGKDAPGEQAGRRNTFTDEFDFTPEIAKVVKAAKVAENIGRDLAKKQR
eukprot:gene14871-10632_t